MKLASIVTRVKFKELVLRRNGGVCCVPECQISSVDAHHIIERCLWVAPHELGGYYLENGAGLCGEHHYQAEQTVLSAQSLREWCGIDSVVLPEGFDPSIEYTKWGDPVLADGTRCPGPLFWEASVQKVVGSASLLELYGERVFHPLTLHLPWSPGRSSGVKSFPITEEWEGVEYVILGRCEGELTTVYPDGYVHGRFLASRTNRTCDNVAEVPSWAVDIPRGWRVVGENVGAGSLPPYQNATSRFRVHSIWDCDQALSWDATIEWCGLLGLTPAVTLWSGTWSSDMESVLEKVSESLDGVTGYVCRPANSYLMREHSSVVGEVGRLDCAVS